MGGEPYAYMDESNAAAPRATAYSKVLLWEKNGFVIWRKRTDVDTLTISGRQLTWPLDGIDV